MKKYHWFLALLLLLSTGVSACDESILGDDDAVPTAINIGPDGPLEVAEGATLELTATDQNATALPSGVSWWATDESVATVNAIGVVTGVGVGTTMVHARLGELEDSVEVKVTFGEIAAGEMKVVLTGDIEQRYTIRNSNSSAEVLGVQAEFLDHTEWNFGYVYGETWSSNEDFFVVLALPGALSPGQSTVTPASEPGWIDEAELIYLQGGMTLMGVEGDGDDFLFHTTGGSIEITAVETPGGTWDAPTGSVRGTATFTADEYRESWDEASDEYTLEATGRSVRVAVGFNAPAFLYEGGYMDLTVSGGPYGSGTSVEGWGSADYYSDGSGAAELYLDVSAISGAGLEQDLWVFLRDPSVGTHQVRDYSTGPAYMDWQEGEPWSGAGTFAESVSGTLTLDQLQPATGGDWGLTTGSMDTSLEIINPEDGTRTGEFISITGTFAVPLDPDSDMAGGTMADDERSRHLPSILSGPRPDRRPLRR